MPSQTTGDAIPAMACLEGPGSDPVSIEYLSWRTKIPQPSLCNVIQMLAGNGFLKTQRGHKGGVPLGRPPEHFAFLEIAEAVEGIGLLGDCLLGMTKCARMQSCSPCDSWREEGERMEGALRARTRAEWKDFRRRCLLTVTRGRRRAEVSTGQSPVDAFSDS